MKAAHNSALLQHGKQHFMKLSAKITRGNETKYDNREYGVYKNYIYVVTYKGVGDPEYVYDGVDNVDEVYKEYKPFKTPSYNRTAILEDYKNLDQFTKEVGKDIDIEHIVGTQYEKYLVKEGENKGGLFIELYDREAQEAEKARKSEEENDKAILRGEKYINFVRGIFGFQLTCHIPAGIFSLIKPFAEYHNGDEDDKEWADDMGYPYATKNDLKGWFFKAEAIDTLIKTEYKISYQGEPVDVDLETTIARVKEAKKKHWEEVERRDKKISELKQTFRDLYQLHLHEKGLTKEDVSRLDIYSGNIITLPAIEVTGHDIYGGGVYIVEKDNNYYVIKNNGGDGDDWSYNNYHTGGAGAIAYSVKDNDKMRQLIIDAKTLERK